MRLTDKRLGGHGLNPKSLRTFTNYVNKLVELEYLKVERSKSRGMSGSSKLVKKLQNL